MDVVRIIYQSSRYVTVHIEITNLCSVVPAQCTPCEVRCSAHYVIDERVCYCLALYNNYNLVNNKSNLFPVDQTGQVSLHKYTVHLILCLLYVHIYV